MNKFKILFVDEQSSERRRFQRYILKNDQEKTFKLDAPEPDHNLNDFVSKVIAENYDAVITDFNLKLTNSNIEYNGLELVEAILEIKHNFPCFIITSFEDEAIRDGQDVNMVYIKAIMNPKKEEERNHKSSFIDRIKNQIEHYRKKIKDIECEIKVLVARKDLNADEEIRLLELDSTLEKMTNQPSSIPSEFKSKTNLEALHKLINNTDQLLKSLK